MKYRARANGNILDSVPESLIGVLYDPVEDEAAPSSEAEESTGQDNEDEPDESRDDVIFTPEAPLENVSHTKPAARKRRPRRKK